MKSFSAVCAVFGLAALAPAAQAQDMTNFGLEAGVSTLGLFIAPDVELAPNFRLRAPLYYGNISGDVEYDGNDGTGELSITSLHVVGDYYLGNSGVRLTGGLSFGGYELEGTFVNPTLDGRTYNATITGLLEQDDTIVPVLAIGYQHSFGARWGLSAEIGARITSMDLTTTGQNVLSAADLAQFNQEIRDINDDLDDFKILPFVSLGVTYRF